MPCKTTRAYYCRWIDAIYQHILWISEYLARMRNRAMEKNKKELIKWIDGASRNLYLVITYISKLDQQVRPRSKKEG